MITTNPKSWIALAATGALLSACASAPKVYPELENAHAAVSAASADADAVRYAPLDLEQATKHLAAADDAARHHEADDVRHEAYLATQKAGVAQDVGREKVADAHVANGDAERQRVQLEVSRREAELAKAHAAAVDVALVQAQSELAALNAKQTSRGTVVTLGDVLFDSGRARLKAGAGRSIDSLVQFLNNHPERTVMVEGFTDSVGSTDFNLALSQQRADAVKSALIDRGISGQRIQAMGRGKEYPIAGNDDSAGRQLNRRVELTISDAAGNIPTRQASN